MASWWYCLKHTRVEEGDGCPDNQRLGPYASRDEAQQALDRAHDRTADEDARDRAEDDWG